MRFAAGLAILALLTGYAQAQTPAQGRLLVTVADQTTAVIPGAKVIVTRLDGPTPGTETVGETSAEGLATIASLPPGRYSVRAEFAGFDVGLLKEVRVRAGDNRQRIVLAIQKVEDTVTVGQDPQNAASDRRGPTFGTVLTREQIDALSDDPDELRRQLQDIAGPGAVIRVDSFEGAQLPPKSQIRMIRISRDQFAAENHFAGGISIDIVTQPGIGPLRGGVNMRLRDGSMTARSPFVRDKGPERTQQYGFNLGGSLARERTSFNLNVNGLTSFETPNLNVALPGGTRTEALSLRRPRDQVSFNINLDHALTLDQTLRFTLNRSTNSASNLGIGDYDLPERAYSTEGTTYTFRAQHVGPLGRRFFMNTRLLLSASQSETRSSLESSTYRVLDAFTSGGQQLAGGTRNRGFNLASDLDYVRGIHSIRTGIVLDNGWYHSDSTSNYLGTYTFENLAAFEAGQPRSFTRRIGDPNIDYFNLQGGLYVQDDIRLRRNLTFSPGLRYELQTHVSDFNNLAPRFGVTWAPGTSGRTSLRASSGIFYDWLGSGTYEQTLRVDGFRQRELNVADPLFPDPGTSGLVPPVNRYLLSEGVRMPRQLRFSGGIDQQVVRQTRVGLTWTHLRGTSLQRGRNLNAPVDGVRPFPEFGNVIEVVSDARSRQDTLTVFFNASLNRPPPAPPGAQGGAGGAAAPLPLPLGLPQGRSAPLIDWRRMTFNGQYGAAWLRNNTDGDFSVSPTGSLGREWGFAPGDVRHRMFFNVNAQTVRNLTTSVNVQLLSGTPYTLQTGFDDNGDLIFNDRPAGVERNTERARGQVMVGANVQYTFSFGRAASGAPGPTGIIVSTQGGVVQAQTISVPQQGRYRVTVFAQATNLTNRANYVGYSGTLTSPFFGRPRAVLNPRRVEMGMSIGF